MDELFKAYLIYTPVDYWNASTNSEPVAVEPQLSVNDSRYLMPMKMDLI